MMIQNKEAKTTDLKVEFLVIFAILITLGFPGNYTNMIGNQVGLLLEYGAFLIEILAMFLSSGEHWLDLKLLDLERKYFPIYLFAGGIFLESMLVTSDPKAQLITNLRLCVTILFAIWLQREFRFSRMVELFCTAQLLFVIACLIFMVVSPGEAFESGDTYANALRGIYSTKNSFAAELSMGILWCILLIREKRKQGEGRRLWVCLLLTQAVMLLMCQSTGVLFSLLLTLVFLLWPEDRRLPLGWIYCGGSLLFLFVVLALMPYVSWFFDLIGKDATLTGRVPLWNRIIQVMMNHKTLTGYGFGMFWRDAEAVNLIHAGFRENSFFASMTTGAHNMVLEFWLNIGLIGIGLFFAMILHSMHFVKKMTASCYLFCELILMYLMLNGLTERCFSGNYDFKILSLFLVVAIGCNQREGAE